MSSGNPLGDASRYGSVSYDKHGKTQVRGESFTLLQKSASGNPSAQPSQGVQIFASAEVFDFHAFRHTYVSTLVNGGASVKVPQELARHSSPALTIGRYAHTRLHDLRGALVTLHDEQQPAPEELKATETDDLRAENAQRIKRGTPLSAATDCDEMDGRKIVKMSKNARRKFLKNKDVATDRDAVQHTATKAEGTGLEPPSVGDATASVTSGCEDRLDSCAALALHSSDSDCLDLASIDADLREVVAAWNDLSPTVRETILLLARSACQPLAVSPATASNIAHNPSSIGADHG